MKIINKIIDCNWTTITSHLLNKIPTYQFPNGKPEKNIRRMYALTPPAGRNGPFNVYYLLCYALYFHEFDKSYLFSASPYI